MKHRLTNIRTVVSYECGSCGHEWDEDGENALDHAYPDDFIGEEAECPECGKELEVTDPYDDGDEDDEGT